MPDIASLVARVSIALSVLAAFPSAPRGRTRSSRRGLGTDHRPGRDTSGRVAACQWVASGKSRRVVERAVRGLARLRRRRLVSHALHRGGIEGGPACAAALWRRRLPRRGVRQRRGRRQPRGRLHAVHARRHRPRQARDQRAGRPRDRPSGGGSRPRPAVSAVQLRRAAEGQAELVHPERRVVAARVARRPPGALHRRGPRLVEGLWRHRGRRRHRRHGAERAPLP